MIYSTSLSICRRYTLFVTFYSRTIWGGIPISLGAFENKTITSLASEQGSSKNPISGGNESRRGSSQSEQGNTFKESASSKSEPVQAILDVHSVAREQATIASKLNKFILKMGELQSKNDVKAIVDSKDYF